MAATTTRFLWRGTSSPIEIRTPPDAAWDALVNDEENGTLQIQP